MIGASAFSGGLLIGTLMTWLWCRSVMQREVSKVEMDLARLQSDHQARQTRLEAVEEEAGGLRETNGRLQVRLAEKGTENAALADRLASLEPDRSALASEVESLRIENARLQAGRSADAEKLQWVDQATDRMRDAFHALSDQTLTRQSGEFLKRADEKVEGLLTQVRGDWTAHKLTIQSLVDPVRENLTALDRHLRELEQKREGAYQGLSEQLQQLTRTHADLKTTAVTLTQALKSPTVRGQWGEMQLRRVVEMAGMVRHVAFSEQVASGDGGRPDLVIHLPNAGVLPVDAKVPLAAYLSAVEADDDRNRGEMLSRHVRAMRGRVRELGQKKYWDQFDPAPDFVVMFVPNEACLGAAFDQDPDLLEYAIGQKVLVTTPVTLLAMLKAVAFGWQQYRMTDRTRRIAAQGQELYRRLETFVGHLSEVGRQLNRTVEGYNRAVGSLERRLMPFSRRFQEIRDDETEMAAPEPLETTARTPAPSSDGPET